MSNIKLVEKIESDINKLDYEDLIILYNGIQNKLKEMGILV